MVVLGPLLLRYVKKPTYLPNPLAAAGLVRGPAAVRDIVPRTILNNKLVRFIFLLTLVCFLSVSLSLSLSLPPSPLPLPPFLSRICGPRPPAPGWKMIYDSVLLGTKFRLRVTLGLQRTIRAAGGFDRYIYYTPDEELRCVCVCVCVRGLRELYSPTIEHT